MDELFQRLVEAVQCGHLAEVQSILEARPELADRSLSYGNEHRPLHFAVYRRDAAMVRLLMRHGASARKGIHPYRAATTAWMLASDRGFAEIVSVIEEEERAAPAAEPTAETPKDEPDPLRAAAARGEVAWLRQRHAEAPLTNPIRWRDGGLLTVAVRQNQPEALSFLLGIGFDPQEVIAEREGPGAVVSQGYPLWYCGALGRQAMAETLLAHGGRLDEQVDSSGTPVHAAFSHRQWAMVDFFIERGGTVGADTAALYRRADLARRLLDADPANAWPLLEFGASGGSPEIVRMALAAIDMEPEDSRWFRYLANCMDFWNHIPWLSAANPEFDRFTYLECLQLVLGRCSPNLVAGFGRTPLHVAAAMRDHVTDEECDACARALLEAGADPRPRDEILRSTPLGWACRWGRPGVVRLLLAHGADAAEPEAEPWARPRAWAEKNGHREIVRLLDEASRPLPDPPIAGE